jgi:hypothetical protein
MRFRIPDTCIMGNSSWESHRSTPGSVVAQRYDSLLSSVEKEFLSAERALHSTAEGKVAKGGMLHGVDGGDVARVRH